MPAPPIDAPAAGVADIDAPVDLADDAITIDTLLRDRVTLLQPVRGFRSSLDPVLLASFVRPPFGHFADVGCATGAVAFSLAALDAAATGVGIEIQPRLAALARRGVDRNALAARVAIVEGDVRHVVGRKPLPRAGFDLVVSNPPFRALAGGFPSPDAEIAHAHHELTLTLSQCLDAVAALRRPTGRVALVFVASRVGELLSGMVARGLAPRRLRFVHPTLDLPASRVLVEAGASPGGAPPPCEIEPPLPLRGPAGHSEEMRRILGEG
jgi:tRNA1Val (adenine37-N6)-methyltransferase